MDKSHNNLIRRPYNAINAERLTVLLNYITVNLYDRYKADTEIMLNLAHEMSAELFTELSELEGYR